MRQKLVILGAGGFAREVAWLLEDQIEAGNVELLGFAEEAGGEHIGMSLNGYACHELDWYLSHHDEVRAVSAIGTSKIRERVAADLDRRGVGLFSCFDRSARISASVDVGAGTIICAGSILTVNIEIGRSVHINPDCTVAHDVVIGDFVTIAPGAHISGNVTIGKGAFIGTGANIANGTPGRPLMIGEAAVVGAGACVVRDVPAATTVVGVPARPKNRPAAA